MRFSLAKYWDCRLYLDPVYTWGEASRLIINIFVHYFSLIIVACTTRTYTRNLHAQGNRRSKGAARRVRRSARSAVAVVRARGEARALLEVNAMPRRPGSNESCFVVVVVIIIIYLFIYYLFAAMIYIIVNLLILKKKLVLM